MATAFVAASSPKPMTIPSATRKRESASSGLARGGTGAGGGRAASFAGGRAVVSVSGSEAGRGTGTDIERPYIPGEREKLGRSPTTLWRRSTASHMDFVETCRPRDPLGG